ncbi:MAG: hypothetical protein ABIQ40_00650 [Bacteroidia bacterium]
MKINNELRKLLVTHLGTMSDGEFRKTLDAVSEFRTTRNRPKAAKKRAYKKRGPKAKAKPGPKPGKKSGDKKI